MRLSATTALHEFGGLTYQLSGIQSVVLHEIITKHHVQHWFPVKHSTNYAEQILRLQLSYLEDQILGSIRHHIILTSNYRHAVHRARF